MQALQALSMEGFQVSFDLLVTQWSILYLVVSIGSPVEPLFGVSSLPSCFPDVEKFSWCWTCFAGLRSNILKLHYEDNATAKQRAYVSAFSGGIAGGAVTRLMGIYYLALWNFTAKRWLLEVDDWRVNNDQEADSFQGLSFFRY